MNQPYFILVLAHSLHGRLRRIHVPYQFVYGVLLLAAFGAVSVFGFVSSYLRMSWKVANYNSLRQEVDVLRTRYQHLERESRQTGQQLASLQTLATEVSLAYGIRRHLDGPDEAAGEARLIPTLSESLEEYNFLKGARLSRYSRGSFGPWRSYGLPSIWPVDGVLASYFGRREDPFNGMGAFHSGIDIAASRGDIVKATADGVISLAEYAGGYGKLVIVDHADGYQTYYAHMSRLDVVEGQTVRRGDTVGRVGSTGRSTSPHLHYEVRRHGVAINPYKYLGQGQTQLARSGQTPRDFPF